MIRKIYIFFSLLIACLICSHTNFGMFPLNLFRAWDINLRPPIWCGTRLQITAWTEATLKTRAIDSSGNFVNPLQIWNGQQNALAMLQGFPADSPITQFFVNTLGSPTTDGFRGFFNVTGDFSAQVAGVALRYHAPHNITMGVYLPIYHMEVKNVKFVDQTKNVTSEDIIVKQDLTDNFFNVVAQFDPKLNLRGWNRWGCGDLVLLAEWIRDFPQPKPMLRNVQLNARAGLTIPTGLKKDENDILSIPFGFDGSAGIIFGGGIALTWWDYIRAGLDVEFVNLFGTTRDRRIKVNTDQTDFLLLAKVKTYKEFGFTHRFNLFVEAHNFFCGLSASLTYQYWKHGDDKLSLFTNEFSTSIANSAESLQSWTMHYLIGKLQYDLQEVWPDSSFKPQLALFYKVPVNGKRALLARTIGGIFSISF